MLEPKPETTRLEVIVRHEVDVVVSGEGQPEERYSFESPSTSTLVMVTNMLFSSLEFKQRLRQAVSNALVCQNE